MSRIILLPGSIKLPNTKRKLVRHRRFFYSPLVFLCCVLTAARCQVGSSSSRSPSRSGEAEQLPWQHRRNGGARGTLTYDIGASSQFTQAYHKSINNTPTPSNGRRPFTCSQAFSQQKVLYYSEDHSKPVHCRPAKHAYNLRYKKPPLTALHTAVSHHPPLSSSALCTHTYLPTQPC